MCSSFTSEKHWNHLFSLHCKHTSMHTFKHVLSEQISTVYSRMGTKSRRWWTVRRVSYSSTAFPARMANNVFTVRKSMLWQQKAVLTALATSNLIVFLTCCLSSFRPCYMSFPHHSHSLCCCFCLLVVFLLFRNVHTQLELYADTHACYATLLLLCRVCACVYANEVEMACWCHSVTDQPCGSLIWRAGDSRRGWLATFLPFPSRPETILTLSPSAWPC